MTLWFDVEDLLEYARVMPRPSGIQRLSFELYAAVQASAGAEVGFVRHDPLSGTMRVITWPEIETVYHGMTRRAPASPSLQESLPAVAPVPLLHSRLAQLPLLRNALRRFAGRLPPEVRLPLGEAVRAQLGVARSLTRTARALPRLVAMRRGPQPAAPGDPVGGDPEGAGQDLALRQDLRQVARPGDTLVVLGSPWSHADYAGFVSQIARTNGLRFAMLVYDLIPLLRPEFCDRGLVMVFSTFMRGCLPITDQLFAISEATARDTAAWAAREGITLRAAPEVLPIGTGFTHANPAAVLPAGLSPGGYALFVSTIEARKNHVLAFRAWRRLLEDLPREQVPTLVFAGRVGWMVADLMQQIANSEYLGGKLVIVENPDDSLLAALYRGARFTLFPSLYEGWGLPVSESLDFGKVCLASSSTSVPEAGGRFCLYHDPDSVTEAVALYRRAIEEPGVIAEMEARIAREYRPTLWSAGAEVLLKVLR